MAGGNKVCYSISTNNLDVAALRQTWDEFVAWSSRPGSTLSLFNIEMYSTATARAVSADASAIGPAIRTCKYHVFLCTMFDDDALAGESKAVGDKFRRAMRGGGEAESALV